MSKYNPFKKNQNMRFSQNILIIFKSETKRINILKAIQCVFKWMLWRQKGQKLYWEIIFYATDVEVSQNKIVNAKKILIFKLLLKKTYKFFFVCI